ncbi:MAG: TonB-dependent receptor [Cyclobacteriaceae bacterium]|nr:TonB-dependent receptor [Cyclobacteriaceae bacterium SS2]
MAQNFTITGKVTDKATGNPLEFANVAIFQEQDSSLVTGGITEADGSFRIEVSPGNYYVRIQFVTYGARILSGIEINKSNPVQDFGEIILVPQDAELEEVVVQAERTQMQLQLDKKVYNVGKDLSNLGGSASDLLANLPSVSVDVEGNVELRGSTSVKVLIDGKPSGLVGLSSTDALRQMQGNMIETVEIITNPSARYDAEGMAGIINIILKKDQKKGVNGSFQINTGWPHNHGASVNMNLRRNWVNFFINYGIDYRKAPGTGETLQRFPEAEADEVARTDQYTDRVRGGISNSVRFGSDFFLNDKTSITTAFLYRYSDELNESAISFEDFNLDDDLLDYTLREDDEEEGDENLEYSVNFSRTFSSKDHKLTADFQYQSNNEIEQSNILQSNGATRATMVEELQQKVRNDEGENRLMLQSDYIHPFGEKGKFELGYRSTIRNVKNNYTVDEADETGAYMPVDTFTIAFDYNERVHAFYGIISDELEKISWQVGLRSETTNISSELEEQNRNLNWNYTNLFPSAFFTYKLLSGNQVQLSYSRRIERPRFRELSPMTSFSNNRRFRVGNPNLQPEFTDSYELGFLQNMSNSSIYYGVYYRYTDQLIQRVTLPPNELLQTVTIPYNAGISRAVGVEVNVSQDFTEWYRLSGNVNFYRQESNGVLGDTLRLDAKAVTLSSRINNNFTLSDRLTAQMNFWYRAPEQRAQGRRLSMSSLDLGLSYDVFNNNGTISLNVRDLFNTRKYRYTTELATLVEDNVWQWRKGPTFNLAFVYRLNQKKQRERGGDRDGGDGDFDM